MDYTKAMLHAIIKKSPIMRNVNAAEYSEAELRCLINLNTNTEIKAIPLIMCKFVVRTVLVQLVHYYPIVGECIKPENISCRLEYDELINMPVNGDRMSIYIVAAKNVIINTLGISLNNISEFLDNIGRVIKTHTTPTAANKETTTNGERAANGEESTANGEESTANGEESTATGEESTANGEEGVANAVPPNKTTTTTNINDISTLRRLTEEVYNNTLSDKFSSYNNSKERYTVDEMGKQPLKRNHSRDYEDDEYHSPVKHSATWQRGKSSQCGDDGADFNYNGDDFNYNYNYNYNDDNCTNDEADTGQQQHQHKGRQSDNVSRRGDSVPIVDENEEEEEEEAKEDKNMEFCYISEELVRESPSVNTQQQHHITLLPPTAGAAAAIASVTPVSAASLLHDKTMSPVPALLPATAAAASVTPVSASPSHSNKTITSPAASNVTVTTTQQQQQLAGDRCTRRPNNDSTVVTTAQLAKSPLLQQPSSLSSQPNNTAIVVTEATAATVSAAADTVVARSSSVNKRDLLESFVRDSCNNVRKANKDDDYFRNDDDDEKLEKDILLGNDNNQDNDNDGDGDGDDDDDDDGGDDDDDDTLSITPSNSASQNGYYGSYTGSCTNQYAYGDSATIAGTAAVVKKKNISQLADIKLKSSCNIDSFEKTLKRIARTNGIVDDVLVLSDNNSEDDLINDENDNVAVKRVDNDYDNESTAAVPLARHTSPAKPTKMITTKTTTVTATAAANTKTNAVSPPLVQMASVSNSITDHKNTGDCVYVKEPNSVRDSYGMVLNEDTDDYDDDDDDYYYRSENAVSSKVGKLEEIRDNTRNDCRGHNDYYDNADRNEEDEEEEEEDHLIDRLLGVK